MFFYSHSVHTNTKVEVFFIKLILYLLILFSNLILKKTKLWRKKNNKKTRRRWLPRWNSISNKECQISVEYLKKTTKADALHTHTSKLIKTTIATFSGHSALARQFAIFVYESKKHLNRKIISNRKKKKTTKHYFQYIQYAYILFWNY